VIGRTTKGALLSFADQFKFFQNKLKFLWEKNANNVIESPSFFTKIIHKCCEHKAKQFPNIKTFPPMIGRAMKGGLLSFAEQFKICQNKLKLLWEKNVHNTIESPSFLTKIIHKSCKHNWSDNERGLISFADQFQFVQNKLQFWGEKNIHNITESLQFVTKISHNFF